MLRLCRRGLGESEAAEVDRYSSTEYNMVQCHQGKLDGGLILIILEEEP
jgi:hypothetical protein